MKKLLISLSVVLFTAFGSLRAQDDEPPQDYKTHACKLPERPNILDYFAAAAPYIHPANALMKDALEAARRQVQNPEMAVAERIVDLPNGYISITIGWNEDTRQVDTCYWRMNDDSNGHKRALLGVYYFWGCDDSALRFFEFDLTDRTFRAVRPPFKLPKRFDSYGISYYLPRKGKTIKAVTYNEMTSDGEPLTVSLTFNGTSFDITSPSLKP